MEENIVINNPNNKGLLEKISFWVLSVMTFLVPIFFVPASFISTQFGTSLLFSVGVISAVLLMIVASFGKNSFNIPQSSRYMFVMFILVPLVYILAGISNGFSRMSFLGYTFDITTLGFIFLAFIYLFLVSTLFSSKKRILYSFIAFLGSALLVTLFLLIRIIFGANVLSFGIFTNLVDTTVGNWNNVGIFFGVGAILSLISFQMFAKGKLMKITLLVSLLFSLFLVSLVNFGSIWIILSVISVLLILYGIFSPDRELTTPSKRKLIISSICPFIVLVVSIVFAIWGNTLGGSLAGKMNILNTDVRPNLSVTLDIAKNTIKNQPLFGSGPNSFVTQWLSYKPVEIISTPYWNTDFAYGIGLIPTFAVTTGLLGLLSWIAFFCFYVYVGTKSLFTKSEDNLTKYLSVSSFFISLFLWIMTWVYIPSIAVFVLTFFFTGLFFASSHIAGIMKIRPYKFSESPRKGFVSSFVAVVLFVAVSAMAYGLYNTSASFWYFQKSAYALNAGDISTSKGFMEKAIGKVSYDVYYRALSEIELAKIDSLLAQDVTKVSEEELKKQYQETLANAITAAINARDTDPSNYLNWISLGTVYQSAVATKVSGAYDSALFAYNEAFRRNSKNPGILMLLARLEIANGNVAQARNYVLAAIQAKQNYLDAYYLLTQIEVANNNLRGAIESVQATTIINPSDPSLFFQLGLLRYYNSDFTGAVEAFEKSVNLAPDYANAKYFLGLCYEVTKNHDKAIAMFEDLSKTNPDNTEITAILEKLKAGSPIFTATEEKKTDTKTKLPVKENQ